MKRQQQPGFARWRWASDLICVPLICVPLSRVSLVYVLLICVPLVCCTAEVPSPVPLPAPGGAHSAAEQLQSPPDEPIISAPQVGLLRLLTATRVQRRRPLGVSERFSLSQQKVWAYLEAENTGEQQDLLLLWYHRGELRESHTLKVGRSRRWRTWSRLRLRSGDLGDWRIELLDRAGRRLGTHRFQVSASMRATAVNTPESAAPLPERVEDPINRPFQVTRFVLTSAVRQRRPQDERARFPVNRGRVWGYLEAFNPHRDRRLIMSWRFKGQERFRIPVGLGQSRRWRTWTRILPSESGPWSLCLLDHEGRLIMKRDFEVYD